MYCTRSVYNCHRETQIRICSRSFFILSFFFFFCYWTHNSIWVTCKEMCCALVFVSHLWINDFVSLGPLRPHFLTHTHTCRKWEPEKERKRNEYWNRIFTWNGTVHHSRHLYIYTLNYISPHKSLCQNVNVCHFNFNNAHTYCRDISTPLPCCRCFLVVNCYCCYFVSHGYYSPNPYWLMLWRSLLLNSKSTEKTTERTLFEQE